MAPKINERQDNPTHTHTDTGTGQQSVTSYCVKCNAQSALLSTRCESLGNTSYIMPLGTHSHVATQLTRLSQLCTHGSQKACEHAKDTLAWFSMHRQHSPSPSELMSLAARAGCYTCQSQLRMKGADTANSHTSTPLCTYKAHIATQLTPDGRFDVTETRVWLLLIQQQLGLGVL